MAETSNHWLMDTEYFVCSGGALKAMLVVGALSVLEVLWKERGGLASLKGVGGSSIGGMIAMLIAAGFTSKEIQLQFEHDLDFIHGDNDFINLTTNYGINSGTKLVEHLKSLLVLKGFAPEVTLAQFYANTGKLLRIVVSNLTTEESETWDAHSAGHRLVVDAIATSMALPMLFCPTVEETITERHYYVDGGVLWNLPFDLFDPMKTLAIWLPYQCTPIHSFKDYTERVLFISWKALQDAQYKLLPSGWKQRILSLRSSIPFQSTASLLH